MKKLSLLFSFLLMMVMLTSCGDKKIFSCIPESADIVAVVDLSSTSSDKELDKGQLDKMMDEMGIPKEQREIIIKFADDPKSVGVNLMKKFALYIDVDEKDLGLESAGCIIPVLSDDNLAETMNTLNKKDNGFFCFKNIQTQNDFSFVYPFEKNDVKDVIIGWNSNVMMILAKEKVSPADLDKCFHNDKNSSILANKDFNTFKKNLTTLNIWCKSDAFVEIAEEEPEVKDFLREANLSLAGNYAHIHLTMDKEEYKLEVKLRTNESLQNADNMKVMKAVRKFVENIMPTASPEPDWNDYSYNYEETVEQTAEYAKEADWEDDYDF
ncbi:MAG: hypothetical protein J5642_00030 [Bacteroidales bacterium]|nr:hypothetical protein [Bacteroidales bacterium]